MQELLDNFLRYQKRPTVFTRHAGDAGVTNQLCTPDMLVMRELLITCRATARANFYNFQQEQRAFLARMGTKGMYGNRKQRK